MSGTKDRLGRLWTDSVAYVALLTGAGLSIAGNVANVLATRRGAADTLDIVLAVAFPALVVLMVEVFVSSRWQGLGWPMQALRWLGTVSIGAVAMRVSWVHLNALMLSRGQERDVAILGPLAIDFLAIMATALILAGRGKSAPTGGMVLAHPRPIGPMPAPARLNQGGIVEPVYPVIVDETPAVQRAVLAGGVIRAIDLPASVADEAESYLDRLSREVQSETTPAHPIEINPVSPAPARPESVPLEARELYFAWWTADASERPTKGQADAMVAAVMGKDPRTARRWRLALEKAPGSWFADAY